MAQHSQTKAIATKPSTRKGEKGFNSSLAKYQHRFIIPKPGSLNRVQFPYFSLNMLVTLFVSGTLSKDSISRYYSYNLYKFFFIKLHLLKYCISSPLATPNSTILVHFLSCILFCIIPIHSFLLFPLCSLFIIHSIPYCYHHVRSINIDIFTDLFTYVG